jgi:alanyl-tRNA synthetase
MIATRLYWQDAFARDFTAQVREIAPHTNGVALILDQTLFYPNAGGQPHDAGTLNGVRVLDVIERDDKEILHIIAAPDAAQFNQDMRVSGEIEWARRFDYMQQHSGQHILSAAFVRTADLDTISVHISESSDDPCTLDLPSTQLSEAQITYAENEANRAIFADTPIVSYEVSDADLAAIPLRKAPKVSGRIRIVEVKDFDWSACGGTHVRSAGQLGLIKICGVEKRGNNTRILFRCGGRALAHYRAVNQIALRVAGGFAVGVPDLEVAVNRLRDESKDQRKQLDDLRAQFTQYEARELLDAAPMCGDARLIVRTFEGRDMNQLRSLAKALCAPPNVIALLGGVSERAALCFARSANVTTDLRPIFKNTLDALGDSSAKGGGAAELVQGGFASNDLAQVQRALQIAQSSLQC